LDVFSKKQLKEFHARTREIGYTMLPSASYSHPTKDSRGDISYPSDVLALTELGVPIDWTRYKIRPSESEGLRNIIPKEAYERK